jgi:hypothetical protein
MADTYSQPVDRLHPVAFLFLVDQSLSMEDKIAGGSLTKAQSVTRAVNRCLDTFVGLSEKDGKVFGYFDIAVVGYGETVGSVLGGPLAGKSWVSITELAENARTVDIPSEKTDGRPIKAPVWFDPVAAGGTPMCEALRVAKGLLEQWFANRRGQSKGLDVFPPVVVNMTDGESMDGDPIPFAKAIQQLETEDGHALVFNCHVSAQGGGTPIKYPSDAAAVPDAPAKALFEMSSVIPKPLRERAQKLMVELPDGARGAVYNADVDSLNVFLKVGTQVKPPQAAGLR